MDRNPNEKVEDETEKLLEQLIDKHLSLMHWRKDWKSWRWRRINQERDHKKRIFNLETLLGDHLDEFRILEVGCGMGGFLVALILERDVSIIGVDLEKDYLKITKLRGKRYGLRLDIIQAVGENLPLRDGYFDLVVMFDVLEHVQNPFKVLYEVSRVMKVNGKCYFNAVSRFILKDPHYHLYFINLLPRKLAELYIRLRGRVKYDQHGGYQSLSKLHYFTLNSLIKITNKCHLKVLKVTGDRAPKIIRPLINLALHFYPGYFNLLAEKAQKIYERESL